MSLSRAERATGNVHTVVLEGQTFVILRITAHRYVRGSLNNTTDGGHCPTTGAPHCPASSHSSRRPAASRASDCPLVPTCGSAGQQPCPPPPPCDGKVRPNDFSFPPVATTSTDTRWVTVFATPTFCIRYEEQRTTTTTKVVSVTHSCDGQCYVANVSTNVSTPAGPWIRTGNSEVRNFGRSAGEYTLPAGEYEL